MRIGLKREKSQKSGIQLSACSRSTGPCLGQPSTLKRQKSKSQLFSSKMCTDSVPDRPDPVSVDRAHRNLQEIAETCISQTEQKLCVPGRHHGHDVNRIHSASCRTPQMLDTRS
eukprot:TRINITY_DN14066_c0_g3_i1.p1 TRINITY_DN14066_c0_g3~~TRINITY_DN14066_c0_g3_i1.p1  ORF type:complete len:114 (+),score=3.81 TRINITY_DN14066_c0_g3_i1:55-396(+)